MPIKIDVSRFDTLDLQHARRAIEREMEACANGVDGTQAHVGQIDLLTAIGAELDHRDALLPPPPYAEVDREDGFRLSFSVRVF